MIYETLELQQSHDKLHVILHRVSEHNSINTTLLEELNLVLDLAENNPTLRFIILQGQDGIFCSGMDFNLAMQHESNDMKACSSAYMLLLKRFSTTPTIIISLLNDEVLGGGVGLVAASDIVISGPQTAFSLPEALWGLLPACLLPYLIRRIGFQKAYHMTLTTQKVAAFEAYHMGLIDELTDNINDCLRRLLLRLNCISNATVGDLKSYFQKLLPITDEIEKLAENEITHLLAKPSVKKNIKNYLEHKKYPWEVAGE